LPDSRSRVIGPDPISSTPQGFAAHIKAEIARWRKVVAEGNIAASLSWPGHLIGATWSPGGALRPLTPGCGVYSRTSTQRSRT
jgi:hypothetical protein